MIPNSRVSTATLDPRTLYPNQEDIQKVMDILPAVEEQLDQDMATATMSNNHPAATRAVDQTKQYLQLLTDWLEQAKVLFNRNSAEKKGGSSSNANNNSRPIFVKSQFYNKLHLENATEKSVSVDTGRGRPRFYKGLVYQNQGYIYTKKLRNSIYGNVKQAHLAVCDDNMVFRPKQNELFAVKTFSKELMRKRVNSQGISVQEDPIMELAIQQYLAVPGHRNVMPVTAIFQDEMNIYAVLPFVAGGEMFDFVANKAPLHESVCRKLLIQSLDAAEYCHNGGICHRDISLENFLLDGDIPILIDFGLSYALKLNENNTDDKFQMIPHTGALGKFYYMSPEVFNTQQHKEYDGCKADVWSIGVCLFIMAFGVPPWERPSENDTRFINTVINQGLKAQLEQWNLSASPDLLDLLQKIFTTDYKSRPSIAEIRNHPFVNGNDDSNQVDQMEM